jgi:ankyrin repeat protein
VRRLDDQNGSTPLIIAAAKGHANAARLLLDRGASVNHARKARDDTRRTPAAPPPAPRVALSSRTLRPLHRPHRHRRYETDEEEASRPPRGLM